MPSTRQYNFFHYVPSVAPGAAFTAIFTLFLIIFIGLTIKSRHIWPTVTIIGIALMVAGWAARLAAHYHPYTLNLYLLQICVLAFAPTWFSAALYWLFGKLIVVLHPEYSRLKPVMYTVVFVSFDLVALGLQGAGGGLSAQAAAGNSKNLKLGEHLSLAGVVFQLFNMVVFLFLCLEYFWRLHKAGLNAFAGQQGKILKTIIYGSVIASFLIILRNVYRSVEMAGGYNGSVAWNEALFWGLDAIPMVFCVICLIVVHPYFTLCRITSSSQVDQEAGLGEKVKTQGSLSSE